MNKRNDVLKRGAFCALMAALTLQATPGVWASTEAAASGAQGMTGAVGRKLKSMEKRLSLRQEQRSAIERILQDEDTKRVALKSQLKNLQSETKSQIIEILDEHQRLKFRKMGLGSRRKS